MLDFPNAPTVGQKFPSSPIVGIPSYTWDGEKWTTAVGTASGGLAVLYDKAQSLTALQQQQARQNIYAAPFDAMAYGGLQINGGMEVSQEKGAGNTAIGSGPAIYVMDGWYMSISTPGGVVVTGSQAAGYFAGFPKSLNLAVTTAQASIAATDLVLCQQLIEGYRIARLAWGTAQAQPLTISFWSAHHRPGIYSLVVRNPGGTRCYPVTYTQAVADVAQYNTVTIPGCTDGAWTADNTAGIMLLFTLACGSTYTSASNNNWLTTNTLAALGQINAVAATSDVFRITGVIVLPGNEAPSAARSPFVMRSYDQELRICERYWQLMSLLTLGFYATIVGPSLYTSNQLKTVMRVAPTATQFGAAPTLGGCTYALSGTTPRDVRVDVNSTATGQTYVANLLVALDARL